MQMSSETFNRRFSDMRNDFEMFLMLRYVEKSY